DTWGHETGDRALRAVAHAIATHARPQDHIARFGGEEFCMLLPGLEGTALNGHLERLRLRVEDLRVPVERGELRLSVSVGACHARDRRSVAQGEPEAGVRRAGCAGRPVA